MTADQTTGTAEVSEADESPADQTVQAFRRHAAGIPPMTFNVPENFLAYPMQDDPAERMAAAEIFVRELYKDGDEELWRTTAPAIAATGAMNAGAGLAYSAMGVYDNGQDGVATCTLTVTATESDHLDPEVAALGLREILVRDEFNEAHWLDLPCGPAVSCLTITKYPLDPELTGGAEGVEITQGQIQVYIPFPTGPWIAVLTMQTANMEVWIQFSHMMAIIVGSVGFPGAEQAAGAESAPETELVAEF
jgi:hypothetical protein